MWALSGAPDKAHLRRKFYDIYQHDRSPIAIEALRRIGLLYAIERDLHGQLPPARRLARQRLAGPLLDALHEWLSETLRTVSALSLIIKECQYASRFVHREPVTMGQSYRVTRDLCQCAATIDTHMWRPGA